MKDFLRNRDGAAGGDRGLDWLAGFILDHQLAATRDDEDELFG